ncbi:MAG: glycosyltransferase family 9 protein [Cyclobacteriaceae bacterium]|nr:glycosyltransferase family 9 protein [Cyclobacteriaceae bacterium]
MARHYSSSKAVASKLLEAIAALLSLPWRVARRPRPALRRVLLVEPFQMGDVLSLTAMIDPLERKFGALEWYVLTKPAGGAILRMDPRISVLSVDFPWSDHGEKKISVSRTWNAIRQVWRFRRIDFDLGIDTRGDIRSQLLMVISGCRMRLGYRSYLNSNLSVWGLLLTHYPIRPKYRHRFEWNLYLLTALGMEESELFPLRLPCFSPSSASEQVGKRYPVVHVGGGWIHRRWPEENWMALIRWLAQRVDWVHVIGGEGEREILDRIALGIRESANVRIEVTDLSGLVRSISRCSFFVGLDSGPMNLAASLNRPSIALFGPGDTEMWRPLSAGSVVVRRTENFPCSPCLQITCLYPGRNCMHAIQVADVVSILERLLNDISNQPSTP